MTAVAVTPARRQICRSRAEMVQSRQLADVHAPANLPVSSALTVLRQLPSLLVVLICAGVPVAILLGL